MMIKGQVSLKDSETKQPRLWQQTLDQWSDLLHGFIGNRLAVLGAILMLIILILAILAPVIKPHDPLKQNLRNTLVPPAWYAGGSIDYLLGTDHFGRDILSRLLYGARASLPASGLAAIFALLLGTSVGLVAGYFGGALDTLLTGIVDVFLAFPLILMALALAAILGPSLRNLVIVMALTGWMSYARVVRSAVLSLKNTEFVTAAVVIGARDLRIILRHIFPNVIGQTLVLFAYGFSQFIILESALSFLGLGIPPPTPTWGRMLYEGRDYLTVAPWTITFPGIAIMLTVLSNNFIGDGLRDALDPSLRRSVQ
jgi:ABC-type dipeptide/oligopeptide/nickel transport system permease subunit